MKRIIDQIFKRNKLIILLFVIMLGYGIYSYFVIPKQEMPEINTPFMAISIEAPSMSAREIEQEIVDDVEKVIMTFSDVTEVKSNTYDHYTVILAAFSFSTEDPAVLTAEIIEKLDSLTLSDNITNINYTSNFDDPAIIFAVHSDTLDEIELQQEAQAFKNNLLLIDEISTITIDSVFNKEVVITLDSETLNLYSLSIIDVYSILYANSLNIPLGGIDTEFGTISISGNISYDNLEMLEDLIIIPEIPTVMDAVTLSQLGSISIDDTSTKEYEFNGQQAIFLSVHFDSDIDFTKLGDEVLENKEEFLLVTGNSDLEISEMLFLPDYVNEQISNVFSSLLIAIAIVMVIVFIGIGFRNSILIIITIPIIVFSTIAVLNFTGFELHKLTIVGLIIAIGILVDNQIVITEGTKRNIDMGMEKVFAAKKAIRDNLGPVLSSTLTTIAAFIVIVMLPGFLGEVVSSMPLTVIIAVSLSFIVGMTLSPIIATIFLKANMTEKPTSTHEIRIKSIISKTIKYPVLWIVVSVLSFVGIVYWAFVSQPIDLYPNDERSVIYIDYENEVLGDDDSNTLLKESIIDIFEDDENMINYASSLGGNLPQFHFSAKYVNELSYVGRLYINYDMTEKELLNHIEVLESSFKEIDNAKISVNVLELSPPTAPVMVYLQSENSSKLDSTTIDIIEDLDDSSIIKTYTVTQNIKATKFKIDYDFTAMSSAFITKAQIDQMIAIQLNGFDLNIYEFNDELINVNINSDITSPLELLTTTVYSDVAAQDYPLSTFITITEEIDYVVINRSDNREVSIFEIYQIDGVDNFELQEAISSIIDANDTRGITVTYGGENDMFEEISGDLIRASIIALVGIFIIMFIQFNNFVKPLIVLLTIPLSFTGSFLFLIIFNEPITATALVGMVSLLGVTVNTGILLVEYISRSHHGKHDIKEACVNAVYLRFRPIMLTSTTTILGLIPLALTGGNFFRPLAITFMGGLITSTIITIFLIPSVYYLLYRNKE